MYFRWDPIYWLFVAPAFLFMLFAQWKVRTAFAKWQRIPNQQGITGKQAAGILMQRNNMNLPMHGIAGELTDSYDPRSKALNLSQESTQGHSIASLAIVAHELGHADQDADNYLLLRLRSGLVPAVNIGSQFGPILFFIGMILNFSGLMWLGIIIFASAFVFALVTLPVELNASSRAIKMLDDSHLLADSEERAGAKEVLSAAALTYIAGVLTALFQLLYYVSVVNRRNRN